MPPTMMTSIPTPMKSHHITDVACTREPVPEGITARVAVRMSGLVVCAAVPAVAGKGLLHE